MIKIIESFKYHKLYDLLVKNYYKCTNPNCPNCNREIECQENLSCSICRFKLSFNRSEFTSDKERLAYSLFSGVIIGALIAGSGGALAGCIIGGVIGSSINKELERKDNW